MQAVQTPARGQRQRQRQRQQPNWIPVSEELTAQLDGRLQTGFAAVTDKFVGQSLLQQAPYIVTMTTQFLTNNLEGADIDQLKDGNYGEHVSVKPSKRAFKNAIIFSVVSPMSSAKTAVKVFKNGRLHVTGPKSFQEAYAVAGRVLQALALDSGLPEDELQVTHIDVQMINVMLRIPHHLYLEFMHDAIRGQPGADITFDKVHHAAINVKFPVGERLVTCLVYTSGAISVSGAKAIDDVQVCFEAMLRLLTLSACEGAFLPCPDLDGAKQEPKKRGRKRKADVEADVDGARWLIGAAA